MMPDTKDGIFIAVVAVIPENITAMVIIIADQKPKDAIFLSISMFLSVDSLFEMIHLRYYLLSSYIS